MLVPTVVTIHLLKLNAARTTIWAGRALLALVASEATWWAVLTLLTFGTCMLTNIILGRRALVTAMVLVLLDVRVIIVTLRRELTITVKLVSISLRLLVTTM